MEIKTNINKSHLLDLIDKFKSTGILVVGDLILDEFIAGDVVRISREAPIPIIRKKSHEYIPGGAANTANNIVALGGICYSLGTIGDDISASNLIKVLNNNGVKTDSLVVDKNNPTTTKTRISAYSKQSVKQQVARLDTLPNSTVLEKDIRNKLVNSLEQFIDHVDTILISDYENGVVSEEIIEKCLKLAKEKNKHLVVDSQGNLGKFQEATILTPNQPEAENVVGYEIKDQETLKRAGNDLLKLTNAKSVLITRGSEGMALFEKNGNITQIPAFNKTEVFDVTGAGDTVVSTLALGIASGFSLSDAMALANLAASIVIRRFGTSTTNINEMKNVLLSEFN
jgi:rfaE bifunctional protein kinase chain/domain